VLDGRVIGGESDGDYHYYPTMEQARAWLADAGFVIVGGGRGGLGCGGYAYHHVVARLAAPPR
jgi:hypothetical protein